MPIKNILKILKKEFGKALRVDFPASKFTSLGVGGKIKYFLTIKKESELLEAVNLVRKFKLPWSVIGEGSNLLVSDKGFPGLVIQNKVRGFMRKGNQIIVGAGTNLARLIVRLDKLGLAGVERMAGIPGTLGGAIYGNAGTYGREIKDIVERVRFFDGGKFRNFTKNNAGLVTAIVFLKSTEIG